MTVQWLLLKPFCSRSGAMAVWLYRIRHSFMYYPPEKNPTGRRECWRENLKTKNSNVENLRRKSRCKRRNNYVVHHFLLNYGSGTGAGVTSCVSDFRNGKQWSVIEEKDKNFEFITEILFRFLGFGDFKMTIVIETKLWCFFRMKRPVV